MKLSGGYSALRKTYCFKEKIIAKLSQPQHTFYDDTRTFGTVLSLRGSCEVTLLSITERLDKTQVKHYLLMINVSKY